MAKLTKVAQKLFGSDAGFHQIIKFGSLFAGATAYTTDIAEMMGLSNWLTGWYAAAIGGNAPTIQDMNAVHTVMSYQLAYIMQAGVAEWDTDTVYYQGSFVGVGGVLYVSLTDANSGNAITDTANWKPFSTEATGAGRDHWTSVLPPGWIWADGHTIGNAASNATNRANVDTLDLYTRLWTDYNDTYLPIYTSAGVLSVRGGSAAADWAANKAISIIDKRGRVSAGKDNMGGTAANRMTSTTVDGTILGNAGGEQVHTLNTGEMPSHNHTQDAHNHTQDAHHHDVKVWSTGGGSSAWGPTLYPGSRNTGVVTDDPTSQTFDVAATNQATTATNQSTGGGGAHNNLQPTIVCNYILKL